MKHKAFIGAIALVVGLIGIAIAGPGAATHQPANKIAVSAGSIEIVTAPLVNGATQRFDPLMTATLRASSPTDLLFEVNLECALWTTVATVGNDVSESMARVRVWVEFDGVAVPVSGDDVHEPGKVVFCDRTHRQTVTDLDDEDARIEQYLATRAAQGFQWILLNVGSGTHTIVVQAELTAESTDMGDAKAGVGKRTLTVFPEKFANDANI